MCPNHQGLTSQTEWIVGVLFGKQCILRSCLVVSAWDQPLGVKYELISTLRSQIFEYICAKRFTDMPWSAWNRLL